MMRAVFLSPLFRFPIPWIDAYISHFNRLPDHWRHIMFTDQPIIERGNVEVVPMTVEDFVDLTERRTGCRPTVSAPGRKFGDMRPSFGVVFSGWIGGFDYWGHTDMDWVMGWLDDWQEEIEASDIFSDDPGAINGCFSLYRNTPKVNGLFALYPRWRELFQDATYHAYDEGEFSAVVRQEARAGRIRFADGFRHEHDRMADHVPIPQVAIGSDGRLRNTVTGCNLLGFHFKESKYTRGWPKWMT